VQKFHEFRVIMLWRIRVPKPEKQDEADAWPFRIPEKEEEK